MYTYFAVAVRPPFLYGANVLSLRGLLFEGPSKPNYISTSHVLTSYAGLCYVDFVLSLCMVSCDVFNVSLYPSLLFLVLCIPKNKFFFLFFRSSDEYVPPQHLRLVSQ